MKKPRIIAILLLVLGIALGYFSYGSQQATEGFLAKFPFKLGLDLQGGSHLLYRADTSDTAPEDVNDSMESLRDIIERRVNLFGVSEPLVQTEESSFGHDGTEHRLIIELPGVTDVDEAIALIGATPLLEFKTERPESEREAIIAQFDALKVRAEAGENVDALIAKLEDPFYINSPLTGKYLESARLEFVQGGVTGGTTGEPYVMLNFDEEGSELFAQMTRENIGRSIAIFLDNALLSSPVVQSEIPDGNAQISGGFTPEEARTLAQRLNAGALPLAIELVSTQKVGPTLGADALERGVRAGIYGLLLVSLFLFAYYRKPGIVAVIALAIYLATMIFLFKLIPVTLTSAGIAGLILSIGMAVDANILIFERVKEERASGADMPNAIETGFKRAWTSIRDGNISSLLTAAVLFWFGTSIIQGFAITFGLGVIISMWSAITITKRLLQAVYGTVEPIKVKTKH